MRFYKNHFQWDLFKKLFIVIINISRFPCAFKLSTDQFYAELLILIFNIHRSLLSIVASCLAVLILLTILNFTRSMGTNSHLKHQVKG